MKKNILVLSAMAAAMASSFAPNASTQQVKAGATMQQGSNGQQAQQNTPQPAQTQGVQQEAIAKDRYRPTGPISYASYGVSPKEWGMYLQSTGKQRWVKSQRA